jgi:adenosylcobinamide-phosphate synthase
VSKGRWPVAEPVALAALALDAALGWPGCLHARIGHPVGGFARVILLCERRWNRPHLSPRARRLLGIAQTALLMALAAGGAWLIQWAIRGLAGAWSPLLLAIAAWPALAQRSLLAHCRPILRALEAGDLPAARRAVGMIVGRDTGDLDEAGIARAAIESLAESTCDGVVAPLFWLLLLGLPGIWAYKAANTADSLIGHPEEPLRDFGRAAARWDDLLNLLPARLSGLLLCLAGGGGWRVLRRDHGRHASPNAGWPEAAMAGALGIRLGGPVRYDGILSDKDWIGAGRDASIGDMARALRIYLRACAALWIIALGVAWPG